MLTIPQRLPIKQMAMYGSTAMLVGFTGTLVMLRQFAPKDSPSDVAVVETINKKPSTSNSATIETKQADSQSAASVTALPDQGVLGARNASLPAQSYSRTSTTTPTYVAPSPAGSIATAPAPVAPASTTPADGGSGSGSVASQPTSPDSPSGETTILPSLQETITNTNVIDINNVTLP